MRSYCKLIILILLCLPEICLSQDEVTDSISVVIVAQDSLVNGYNLIPYYPNPFSPVIEQEFNLPDSSKVNIFITDTMYVDTLWITKNKILIPGVYRIPPSIFAECIDKKANRFVILHIDATSQSAIYASSRSSLSFKSKKMIGLW